MARQRAHKISVHTESLNEGFQPLAALRSEIENVFDRFVERSSHPIRRLMHRPISNAIRTIDRYEIDTELPGVDVNDINLSIEDDILVAAGEKRAEHECSTDTYFLQERYFDAFDRRFQIPSDVDRAKIDAEFTNGVLSIGLPRVQSKKSPKTRRIKVKTR